jgi:hypothetical protein
MEVRRDYWLDSALAANAIQARDRVKPPAVRPLGVPEPSSPGLESLKSLESLREWATLPAE